jgi:radical SAM superfamily enzyme YgiQ (UPF0313 family)
VRVLLLSGYELGHQPLGLASAAAALRRAGHQTRSVDLSLDEEVGEQDLTWAEGVAFSVPMHTATRLAVLWARRLRAQRPGIPLAAFGLYGPAAAEAGDFDLAVAGEYEPGLVRWANGGGPEPGAGVRVELGRGAAPEPDRSGLPSLDHYARLLVGGEERVAGYVEASRGCVHRCRHCPVPVVYDGRIRIVELEQVLHDVDRLVALGARHITFGDPDFLNGPAHSRRVVRGLHDRHPDLTFDCTVKVEHILAHRGIWEELSQWGLLFVVSALESANNRILERLEKNHTVAQAGEAVRILRDAGIALRPSFLPFTPWTTLADLVDLVDFVTAQELEVSVDAVQYAIRLLVPPGSLLLQDPDAAETYRRYDPAALSWQWEYAEPALDSLQKELEAIAAESCGSRPAEDFVAVHRAVTAAATASGQRGPRPPAADLWDREVPPRLSEAWFCCAEPTGGQLARAVGAAAVLHP